MEQMWGEEGLQRSYFHSATISLLDDLAAGLWLCAGLTFAISLSPLTSAHQRTQAATLLTLGSLLADCTRQGATWLLSHIWRWKKAGYRGPASLCPVSRQHPWMGQHWLSCLHGSNPEERG